MATGSTASTQYLDLHNADMEDLTVDEYLSKDLIRNWYSAWKNTIVNSPDFVQYKGSIEARKRLWYNRYVTICGYPGDGKTSIADNLARYFVQEPLQFPTSNGNYREKRIKEDLARNEYFKLYIEDERRESYEPIYVTTPSEYNQKVDPNKHQLVIIDDIFGEAIMELGRIEAWRPYLEELFWNVVTTDCKTLVVMCVNKAHLQRAPSDIRQLEWFKPGTMIDLDNKDMLEEEYIMKRTNYTRMELNHHRSNHALVSANLLYRIRKLVSKFEMLGEEFFKKPWEYCLNEIDQIFNVDRILYYTLAVTVILDGKLNLNKQGMMDYEGRTRQVIEQLITLLDVPLDVSLSQMRFAAKLLTGFFILPVSNYQWEITHPRIYSLCLSSLMKHSANGIIELLSVNTMCRYVRFGQDVKYHQNELVVVCPKENYEALANRFMLGILSGQMKSLVSNECLQDEHFAALFYGLVKSKGCLGEVVYQKDPEFRRSFFYWACNYGHGHLIKLILSETEAVNIKKDARFKDEFWFGYLAACACPSEYSYLVLQTLHEETGVKIERGDKRFINFDNLTETLGQDLCYLLSMEVPILHVLCLKGHNKSVQYVIDQGADIEEPSKDGMRPIHRAAGRNDKEGLNIVNCLIYNRVDIESKNARQLTPLDMAIESGSHDTVRQLVMAGADINKLQGDKETSYMCRAIQRQDYELVSFLFTEKVQVNGSQGKDLFPPLCHAVQSGNIDLVNDLKSRIGIDMNQSGCNGWSALHVACYMGDKASVEELLTDQTNVNHKDHEGNTPLHLAAANGAFEICEMLLRKGAKPEILNLKRETPLVCAARGNHSTVTWLLLRDGMNLESTTKK